MSLLPPNARPLESALEAAMARISEIAIPVDQLWNPQTCPAHLLPWLAWSLSIDLWSSSWPEATKREAIANAIAEQRRKGTPATLRSVLNRFDPLITFTEWFDEPDRMARYTFRLELPLSDQSPVDYSEAVIAALLRDIAAVKPLRAGMFAETRLALEAGVGLTSALRSAGLVRVTVDINTAAASEPIWATYLQTPTGEPLLTEDAEFLEAA